MGTSTPHPDVYDPSFLEPIVPANWATTSHISRSPSPIGPYIETGTFAGREDLRVAVFAHFMPMRYPPSPRIPRPRVHLTRVLFWAGIDKAKIGVREVLVSVADARGITVARRVFADIRWVPEESALMAVDAGVDFELPLAMPYQVSLQLVESSTGKPRGDAVLMLIAAAAPGSHSSTYLREYSSGGGGIVTGSTTELNPAFVEVACEIWQEVRSA